jgi:hypothetical protein
MADEAAAEVDLRDTARGPSEWQSGSGAPAASPRSIISLVGLGTAAISCAVAVTHFCPDDRKVLVMAAVLLLEAIVFAWLGAFRSPGCSPTPYFAGAAFFMLTALLAIRRMVSLR